MLARLGIALEQGQFARGEEAETIADQRRAHALLDEIVSKQEVGSRRQIVEDEKRVLAIRRGDATLEAQILKAGIKGLHLAGLQHVAAWEDDTVIVGQQHARFGDGIHAAHVLGALVEDEVTIRLLLIRQHLEQDKIANDRVVDLGVVQRLVLVLDRLGVDAFAAVGVVLHLDRQIAADGLDEHTVLDRHMRMLAVAIHLAASALPLELLRGRKDKLVIEAIAQVLQRAGLVIDQPFEGLHLRHIATDRHAHVEMRPDAMELQERGRLVVAIQVIEVLREL